MAEVEPSTGALQSRFELRQLQPACEQIGLGHLQQLPAYRQRELGDLQLLLAA